MNVVDFEASSLDNGFPVSVGIASTDGRLFYAVIKPNADWLTSYCWSYKAQNIHGLQLEHLQQHGRDAAAVVANIRELFGDAEFACDSPTHDNAWFAMLIRASGIDYKPNLSAVTTRRRLDALFDELNLTGDARRAIIDMREEMRTHHALSDAAASVAAAEAARAWPAGKDLRDCRNVIERWKKRVKVIGIGCGVIEKYNEALRELAKR
jgi:hypothetical protein